MRDGTRATFIVALLVATFLVTAFMALRAQMASTYHRTTAEKVIRDWTRVAADELARRTDAQASFYGTYPILQRMLAGEPASGDLVASTNVPLQVLAVASDPPPPEKRVPVHGNGRTYVYAVHEGRVAAFEVNRAALAPSFQRVLDMRPLMPPSLAEGRVTNDAFRFRVTDGARTVFATPARAYDNDGALPVRLTVEEGLLRGMVVEASIDPALAPLLVFGGIPRSLSVYAVTLVLTGALLLIALLQLRKERALARLRSDFVASVSHELRTPLTQIRMFAETLLLDRVRSDEERRRSLAVIDQETRRLAQLVENVLQFSRGERGTLRVTRERTDLVALVAETVELFRPIASARSVILECGGNASALQTEVDRDAVRQIVLNLLDNAVKYGPPNQEVRVTVESPARIIVDDAGPGIPPRERKRIWRRYERLARERDRAVAGAGIGLALVRELVRLHGGTARVEESARGGARFIVELPP